jgi:gold/copper resistance efflux system membrane fusion protein
MPRASTSVTPRCVSPIDGRIGKVITTVGNLFQGGGPVPATLIATILSVNPVYAVFDVDETTWHQVGARMRASAAGGPGVPVEVGLNGEPAFPITARWFSSTIRSTTPAARSGCARASTIPTAR